MPYKQKLTTKAKIRRVAYVLFFTLIAVVIGTIIYLIIEPGGGPRRLADEDRQELTQQERAALLEESREAEARYRELTSGGDDLPGEEAITALREAYDRQRRATVNNPYAAGSEQERLDRLEEEVLEHESEFLARHVEDLRERAEAERDAGNYDAGIELLEEALEVQERINREMRGSSHSSTATVTSLRRDIANWRVEPILEFSREAELRAREAVREERWADAVESYTEARDAQVRINEEYSRTAFVNRSRVNALAEEIASLRTQAVRGEIRSLRETGVNLLAEERFSEAAERFTEAAERQRELNREFPGSRHASSSAVRELEQAAQTALSGELAEELAETVAAMDQSLREGDAEGAGGYLDAAGRMLRRMESEYPLSDFNDDRLSLRLGYLEAVRDRLDGLIEAVHPHLRPVPGYDGISLYALETPQSLYSGIMNRNPSRNEGEDRPVDSVNWEEADEFCRRLSWVLGREVRLPSREEFLAAAGDPDADEASGRNWHLRNSGGESHPVGAREANEHGFHDLRGNVSEWLGPAENRRAEVAGGSYNDEPDGETEPPVVSTDTNQRSAAVGFRFVVVEQ